MIDRIKLRSDVEDIFNSNGDGDFVTFLMDYIEDNYEAKVAVS